MLVTKSASAAQRTHVEGPGRSGSIGYSDRKNICYCRAFVTVWQLRRQVALKVDAVYCFASRWPLSEETIV